MNENNYWKLLLKILITCAIVGGLLIALSETVFALSIPPEDGVVVQFGAVQVSARGSAGPAVDPYTLPTEDQVLSLFAWNYEFTDGGTAVWSDESPVGYDLSQTTETAKPVATAGNRLYFDGTDYMSNLTTWNDGNVFTMYLVFQVTDSAQAYYLLMDSCSTTPGVSARVVFYYFNQPPWIVFAEPAASATSHLDGRTYALTSHKTGAGSESYSIYNEGPQIEWEANRPGDSQTAFYVGSTYLGDALPGYLWKGYVDAIVIYKAVHSEATRRSILTKIKGRIARGY